MNKINNFKLGADPEFFLFSINENKNIPICGMLGADKHNPRQISDSDPEYAILEDNCSLEYNIKPANNLTDWLNNINFVKNYVTSTFLNPKNLLPLYQASCRFNPEDLMNDKAQYMGCQSSWSAWTDEQQIIDRTDFTLRTASFHVHIGYDNPKVNTSIDLVKAFDLFLGVPSVLIDPDRERRKMYGKAGDYRLKSYGVECRCLSGFFQKDEEHLTWVYNQVLKAINFVNEGGIITNPNDIINCINNYDETLANEIIEDYNLEKLILKTNI